MNFSAEHNNWLAVGEMIRMIQKPVSSYVDHVVKNFHKTLCQDFDKTPKCSGANCKRMAPSRDLCTSCYEGWWFKELQTSHEAGKNPLWMKNCDGSKWYDEYWEVAKFFMPALGNNRSTVKDAISTDLSSLLNVLEWMKDKAFLGKTRVNVDSVRKLRSKVRNTWAHAPNQQLSDQQKEDYFMIAADFLEDLENVFPDETSEIEETKAFIDNLKANGVTNVVKAEIENLLLTFNTLSQIKEELVVARKDLQILQSFTDKEAIEDLTSQLQQVKNAMDSCSKKMKEFEKLKDDINQQFVSFEQQLQLFGGGISRDIRDINENIQLMSTDIKTMTELLKKDKKNGRELRSCLPEKPLFTARGKEIEDLIKFLQEEKTGVVSLHGGPGFGKSALAIEVSHRLSMNLNMVVIFTDLSTASNINEATVRICRDVGINPEEDARSALSLMLKNLKDEVVFVLDDIDNLLEIRSQFDEFIRLLRKNSNQKLKIVTTSRASYTIPCLSFQKIKIDEMDEESSMELLKSIGPDHQDEFLQSLANLCGNIPLAMCIAVSLVNSSNDPDKILKHLQDQPMNALKNSETNQFVYKAFETSYIHLTNEQKNGLLRLTVFKGDFSETAAIAVLKGDDSDILTDLGNQSLVKRLAADRYTIHVLIRSFLYQQPECDEKRAIAERLMVAYYLALCSKSTRQSYSKNEFMKNREIFKREAHNIEAVLTICTNRRNEFEILNVLVDSEIYKRSCRFFYNLVRTIISETVLVNFLQSCAHLAKARKEWSYKINFDCILADQEGRKSFWKSDKYFKKMKAIKKESKKYKKDLTEDAALQAYFSYQYGRYLLNRSKLYKDNGDGDNTCIDRLPKACEYLSESFELRKDFSDSPLEVADLVLSLMQLGNLFKRISSKQHYLKDHEEGDKSKQKAERFYSQAIELTKNSFGKHEISATCYKILGDLLLQSRQNKAAMENYEMARRMREELNLNTSEDYVLLLNNIGRCLMFTRHYPEAIEMLEIAKDIAEKLVDGDCPTFGKGKVYSSLAVTHAKFNQTPGKGKEFAMKALKINVGMKYIIMTEREVVHLQEIIDKSSSI